MLNGVHSMPSRYSTTKNNPPPSANGIPDNLKPSVDHTVSGGAKGIEINSGVTCTSGVFLKKKPMTYESFSNKTDFL